MAGKGAGMLEANPAALAVVILFFLVFTLGFEKLLHWLKHHLVRKKKLGLLAAVNNFSTEIMLLGVAILLLNVCEDRIASTCYPVPQGGSLKPWLSRVTGTAQVQGCACCLAKTKGVSDCFLQSKGCPKDVKKQCFVEDDPAFKGLKHESRVLPASQPVAWYATESYGTSPVPATAAAAATAAKAAHGRRRSLLAAAAEGEGEAAPGEKLCNGIHQVTYAECGNEPGKAPIVTISTLHQVHYLLFFMAITHIVTGVVTLLISSSMLKYFARRGGRDSEDSLAADALHAAAAAAAPAAADLDSNTAAAAAGGSFKDVQGSHRHSNGSLNDDGVCSTDGGTPSAFVRAAAAPIIDEDDTSAAKQGAGAPVASVVPWGGKPDTMSASDWAIEVLVFFVRQLTLWNAVSKQEYSVLRACFYYTHAHTLSQQHQQHHSSDHHDSHSDDLAHHHDIEHSHSMHSSATAAAAAAAGSLAPLRPDQAAGAYGPYLTEQVERDGSDVVGLGLAMWLMLLAFVLVSGVIGWATWLFLIFAGALLLLLNTVLLASLRHMTSGGHVLRQQQAWYHWLHRSNLLLGCIKLVLFFFTFVISNALFMASYFGPESCFFSRTGFQKAPVPWWSIMLVNLCLLLNLSLFTLPLYSLTYHTLVVDKALLQSTVRDRLATQAAAAHAKQQQRGGMAHRVASAVRRSLSGSRSSGRGRWQGAQGVRQSDNPRWNDLQATTSV